MGDVPIFWCFIASAFIAAGQAVDVLPTTCDAIVVSLMVVSHIRHHPSFSRKSVIPLGWCLLFCLYISKMLGIQLVAKNHFMMRLIFA